MRFVLTKPGNPKDNIITFDFFSRARRVLVSVLMGIVKVSILWCTGGVWLYSTLISRTRDGLRGNLAMRVNGVLKRHKLTPYPGGRNR